MGRSSQEKIDAAIELLKKGKTFRDVQKKLKEQFHSTMSFSTLSKLKNIQTSSSKEYEKIQRLELELDLFKNLYFDLLEKVKNSDNSISKNNTEGYDNEN